LFTERTLTKLWKNFNYLRNEQIGIRKFLDADKYEGMIDLMLQLYRETVGVHSNEMTLKFGYGFSYLMIRKKA